jgi:Domain of Unknown Function with PDB structure (DUF3857)/Transglutaminase-like superfamily
MRIPCYHSRELAAASESLLERCPRLSTSSASTTLRPMNSGRSEAHLCPVRFPGHKFFIATVFAVALLFSASYLSAQKPLPWPPIAAQDLVLPDPAADPAAPAIILDYQIFTDNTYFTETHYERIKILREEGKRYANVEIQYYEVFQKVEEIRARVTSPEGRSTEFSGTVYDREVLKMKKYRVGVKSFALPDVQVGSIIEYSYRIHSPLGMPMYFIRPDNYKLEGTYAFPLSEWTVQQNLFMRHAKFILVPSHFATHLSTYLHEISRDALQRNPKDGSIQLELNNVPAFQHEDFSGPEENLKMRADLFYTLGKTEPFQLFWESLAKREAKGLELFAGKSKSVEREAASLATSDDSSEAKLRKIYARVQQIRNLSFETPKSKKERKQETLKENKSVEDVLSHGYGYYWEINYAFVALARAAGFQAYPVRIASRDRSLFTPQRFDSNQLTSDIVEVQLGLTKLYLDPATMYCPFGLLPWAETGATGIRLDPVQGTLMSTPPPQRGDTVTRRQADLKLDADGNLQGKLALTFQGQEALARRIGAIEQDESERRKDLEEYVQRSLPQGATAKLISVEGWQATNSSLKAEFELLTPNFATRAGQRLVVPLGTFHSVAGTSLSSATRVNPIYFDYPYESYDEITLELPTGFTIESLPAPQSIDREAGHYEIGGELRGTTLHLRRSFRLFGYTFPPTAYPSLKSYLDSVRSGDEQPATLKSTAANSAL